MRETKTRSREEDAVGGGDDLKDFHPRIQHCTHLCPRKWFGQLGGGDTERKEAPGSGLKKRDSGSPKTARATSQESSSRKAEDIAAGQEVSVTWKANQGRRKGDAIQSESSHSHGDPKEPSQSTK